MNNHPNLNDLIAFVSMDALNAGTVALSAEVNAHLADCAACRARVRDLQTVYDALCREMNTSAAAAALARTAHETETHPQRTETETT